MDLHFVEPDEAPVPPDAVKVRRIDLVPRSDGRRIVVHLELTPFLERPTVEVVLIHPSGEVAAETSIIETVDHQLEFTLHLRSPAQAGEYRCRVTVGYRGQPPVDEHEVSFEMPTA
ncbi:MAG: hypothetical protein WBR18_08830 [Anaerolineales bacterium]